MTPSERTRPEEKADRLRDLDIRQWYENLARGSTITADNYLRSLYNFSRQMSVSPSQVAQFSEERAYKSLLDFVSGEEKRGIAGSAILTYVKAVRSWLVFHGVKVERKIKIRGSAQTPTLNNEETPTQEGLRSILLAAKARIRPGVAIIAHAGTRLEVIGDYKGTDGLRVGDLPDLEVKDGRVTFRSLPARVVVRAELSKTGRQYHSYIGTEAAGYVAAAIEERIRDGETVTAKSAVVAPLSSAKPFYLTRKLSTAIRAAIDKAGFDFRPYNLRCYFATQTLIAESRGKVAAEVRTYWMGHQGEMDARYASNKGKLPKELVEEMRASYHRCEPFLSTTLGSSNNERDLQTRKVMLRIVGFTEGELAKLELETKTDDEIIALAESKREAQVGPHGSGQRAFSVGEVGQMLDAGWEYVAPLGSDQAVLRCPAYNPQSRTSGPW